MAFLSCEEMLAAARSQKITLAEAVLRSDLEESRLTEEQSRAAMHHLWQVMQATSREYDPAQRSRSGLSGGDAAKVEQAHKEGKLLGGDYLSAVTAEALKTAECNACMKRIVAAPTAGSCGVLPAVLLPLGVCFALWGAMNALIILLHLALFGLLADLVCRVIGKLRKKRFARNYAGLAALLLTVAYLGVGWYQASHVWRTAYTVTTGKAVGQLRVGLIADSHLGTTFDGAGFAAHMKTLQAEKPDVVVVAGDFVDERSSRADMVAACKALGGLETPYGVYFVFGNHDKGNYSGGHAGQTPEGIRKAGKRSGLMPDRDFTAEDLVNELEANGVTVLQDETVLLDDRFYLIGRQDASEETENRGGRASMQELTQGLDEQYYSIVLDHQPHDYDGEAASGVDLVLSGHTHGGQLIPLVQLIDWFGFGDDNVYGLERRADTDFVVTSGISDWAISFKTGCRSEYVIVDIQGS